jgi:hypothetical protein
MTKSVESILEALSRGETRETLAQELGYKDDKGLDQYMRRREYVWDRRQQTYVRRAAGRQVAQPLASKALDVVFRLRSRKEDLSAVAKALGFESRKALGKYMASQGYRWSDSEHNFVAEGAEAMMEAAAVQRHSEGERAVASDDGVRVQATQRTEGALWTQEDLAPMVAFWSQHQAALQQLVAKAQATDQALPRYAVPGVHMVKSLQMSSEINLLLQRFSVERGISQREILEIALVHFFQTYGYAAAIAEVMARGGSVRIPMS